MRFRGLLFLAFGLLAARASAQGSQPAAAVQPVQVAAPQATASATAQSLKTTPGHVRPPDVLKPPTADDLLRGSYGPYRANNDLLSYHLSLRVDPVAKTIAGTNVVRFRMLEDGNTIQLELTPELSLDSIHFEGHSIAWHRAELPPAALMASRTFYVSFPRELKKGEVDEITITYHGQPVTQGRFGCFSFDKDKEGKPWITTACEEEGASIWWPNKDQWRDEPQEGMEIDVAVPNGLMDVSNGRFVTSRELGDGYTEWQWQVHYPINNYDVALNIGEYQHWSGLHTNKQTGQQTTLDYYALPEDLAKAKVQFAQVPEMLDAYEHYFGEYPFDKDGYKLIEVPYAGMEHQSAVAYGNHFTNGYYGRDWAGVGISLWFDFIIIHESGHEWFGNAITAADRSDMWIHEGWTTYLEGLYVEYRWGKADGIKYLNGLKPKIDNLRPIIPPRGTNAEPPEDQYFKGALMLNTLRSIIDDDPKWFADIHDFYQHFQYQNIMTEDVVAWWNQRTGMDLTPFFNQYLRHAMPPMLSYVYLPEKKIMQYRLQVDEPGFSMPVKLGDPAHWTLVTPLTTQWQSIPWDRPADEFKVDTDDYYVLPLKAVIVKLTRPQGATP